MADLAAPRVFHDRSTYRLESADLTGERPRPGFGSGTFFDTLTLRHDRTSGEASFPLPWRDLAKVGPLTLATDLLTVVSIEAGSYDELFGQIVQTTGPCPTPVGEVSLFTNRPRFPARNPAPTTGATVLDGRTWCCRAGEAWSRRASQ